MLPPFLKRKGHGLACGGLVAASLLLFIVLPNSTNLSGPPPVDDEDEWDAFSIEISRLLPHAAQSARRSSPEELNANKATVLQQRSEPQISVKSDSPQSQSGRIDTVVKGTSRKLRKKYKLTTGGAVARIKRRPRGDHAGAEVGRGKDEKPPKKAPVPEEDPLTPSDKLLLETNGVWEGIHPRVSITHDPPVWEGESAESPVISPGREDNRTFIFECDRSNPRSDVCTMRGNVQLYAASKTFQMFATGRKPPTGKLSVTPYARKAPGEVAPGSTTSLELKSFGLKGDADVAVELAKCNVNLTVPAVVFSIGGKADNFFYALEDALVPLILTSFRYDREVVFVLLDWHEWWIESLRGVLRTLSKYPPILLGPPGEETQRDREHARVKALFGGESNTGLQNGSETDVSVKTPANPGVSAGSEVNPGEDDRAVFEKPADLLSLLSRRRKALGLERLVEKLVEGLVRQEAGSESALEAGVETGSGLGSETGLETGLETGSESGLRGNRNERKSGKLEGKGEIALESKGLVGELAGPVLGLETGLGTGLRGTGNEQTNGDSHGKDRGKGAAGLGELQAGLKTGSETDSGTGLGTGSRENRNALTSTGSDGEERLKGVIGLARKLLQQWVIQEEAESRESNALNGTESVFSNQTVPRGASSSENPTRSVQPLPRGASSARNAPRGVWEGEPIRGAVEMRAAVAADEWPELDRNDRNIYCFPEVVFGLTTHGNLRVDPALPPFLDSARFNDRWKALLHPGYRISEETGALLPVRISPRLHPKPRVYRNRPKLGLALRSGPERRILNEEAFIYYANAMGFDVLEVPEYASLEELFERMQELDVLVGVHNSMLANLIFMRKGSVLLQIAPFSTAWHADHHYGQGARARGLKYIEYEGSWWESSLSSRFHFDDDVRKDPDAVYQKQGYDAWQDLYMRQSIWLEDSKALVALRGAKRYLLETRTGMSATQGPPVPEYVRGDFYFEW